MTCQFKYVKSAKQCIYSALACGLCTLHSKYKKPEPSKETYNEVSKFTDGDININYVQADNVTWFKARDIAMILGYVSTDQAIRVNVSNEDKKPLEILKSGNFAHNEKKAFYINKSGLQSLISKSKKKSVISDDIILKLNNISEETLSLEEEERVVEEDASVVLEEDKIIYTKTFNFNDTVFKYINVDSVIWFHGKQIVSFIGYKDHTTAIADHVKDKYKKTLQELVDIDESATYQQLNQYEKKTIYISEIGLNHLLVRTTLKNPIIEQFQESFDSIILSIKNSNVSSGKEIQHSQNNTDLTFAFSDINIKYIQVNDVIWFKAKEIATILEYSNTDQTIRENVSAKNKIILEDLMKMGTSLNPLFHIGFTNLRGNEKRAIYINESGLYSLVFKSRKESALKFSEYVTQVMIPRIKESKKLQLQITNNTSFNFNNTTFKFINVDGIIWFDGKQIVSFIGYKDHNKAITNHIKDKYKCELQNIMGVGDSPTPINLNENEKKSIYINEFGLYQLLGSSKLKTPIINQFQDYLYETILPSIRKTGSFSVNQPEPETLIPRLKIKSFYDDNLITQFINKNVIYVATTDNTNDSNEYLNKYGMSRRIVERDLKEHRKTFINFNIVYIRECSDKDTIEKLFEHELKARDLWRTFKVNNTIHRELFVTDNMDYIIKILDDLIDSEKKDTDTDSKNLELELKKIDLELQREKNKPIDLEIQREKTKQLEIELETLKLKMQSKT